MAGVRGDDAAADRDARRGATILDDRVRYAIPFGLAGELARALFVKQDLERIFDYRRHAVAELLGPERPAP